MVMTLDLACRTLLLAVEGGVEIDVTLMIRVKEVEVVGGREASGAVIDGASSLIRPWIGVIEPWLFCIKLTIFSHSDYRYRCSLPS